MDLLTQETDVDGGCCMEQAAVLVKLHLSRFGSTKSIDTGTALPSSPEGEH
jgi:hypothetical protein